MERRRTVSICAVLALGISVGVVANEKACHDPRWAVPGFTVARDLGLVGDEPKDPYENLTPLAKIASGEHTQVYARTWGCVTWVMQKKGDRDWHIQLGDEHGKEIVLEIVPWHIPKLGIPSIESCVEVTGIVLYDRRHGWWEIHPVHEWWPSTGQPPRSSPPWWNIFRFRIPSQ